MHAVPMKGWHGGFISSGGGKAVLESDEDLEEEEVWATVKAREAGSKTRKKYRYSSSSSAWRRSKARSVPEDDGCRQDQEVAADEWVAPEQSPSAPVADWSSKILKKRSKKKIMWDDDTCDAHNIDDDHAAAGKLVDHDEASENDDDGDGDGDGDGDEMVPAVLPPHEYLARRLANTQIASHSMCEGVGRTLKGRDLSKLRNAILTKTGFIE